MIQFSYDGKQYGLTIRHNRPVEEVEVPTDVAYNYPSDGHEYIVKTFRVEERYARFGGSTTVQLVLMDPGFEGLVINEETITCWHRDQFSRALGRTGAFLKLLLTYEDREPADFIFGFAQAMVDAWTKNFGESRNPKERLAVNSLWFAAHPEITESNPVLKALVNALSA